MSLYMSVIVYKICTLILKTIINITIKQTFMRHQQAQLTLYSIINTFKSLFHFKRVYQLFKNQIFIDKIILYKIFYISVTMART